MNRLIITEEERSRILGMHHNAVKKEFLFEAEIKVGMVGTGNYSDTAEGKTYSVIKINDLPCGITEVQLQNLKSRRGSEFAYYKKSEHPDTKNIPFRRNGEGVKSTNPCEEYDSFGDFGRLEFSESEGNKIINQINQGVTDMKDSLSKVQNLYQQPTSSTQPEANLVSQDKDYEYKKVGDKYYFKLKSNPTTPKLQALVKQGKFTNWTEAKKQEAIDAISKLRFEPIKKMEIKQPSKIQPK